MTKRKEINDKVVEWITNKVKTEYADDISLVLLYGSYMNGTANSKSDVDCYYIPKTDVNAKYGVPQQVELNELNPKENIRLGNGSNRRRVSCFPI